jgi:phosphomannomutase
MLNPFGSMRRCSYVGLAVAAQAFNHTPETRFNVEASRKFQVIDEVKARLAADPANRVNDIDGVRVTTADGWWLALASNTQEVLVARAEASSLEGLNRLKAQLGLSGLSLPDGWVIGTSSVSKREQYAA